MVGNSLGAHNPTPWHRGCRSWDRAAPFRPRPALRTGRQRRDGHPGQRARLLARRVRDAARHRRQGRPLAVVFEQGARHRLRRAPRAGHVPSRGIPHGVMGEGAPRRPDHGGQRRAGRHRPDPARHHPGAARSTPGTPRATASRPSGRRGAVSGLGSDLTGRGRVSARAAASTCPSGCCTTRSSPSSPDPRCRPSLNSIANKAVPIADAALLHPRIARRRVTITAQVHEADADLVDEAVRAARSALSGPLGGN